MKDMERETRTTPASRICVGKGGPNTIWTDGTGVAACGSTEDHRPHRFTPAQRPAREDKATGPDAALAILKRLSRIGLLADRPDGTLSATARRAAQDAVHEAINALDSAPHKRA